MHTIKQCNFQLHKTCFLCGNCLSGVVRLYYCPMSLPLRVSFLGVYLLTLTLETFASNIGAYLYNAPKSQQWLQILVTET